MQLIKPSHRRYALHNVTNELYISYATSYSCAKRYGMRGIYAWSTGTGLWGVAREAAKGTVLQYGKRKLAIVVLGVCGWVSAPAVAVFTNATVIVNTAKRVHCGISYLAECAEDCSNLAFLPIDLAIFGQPIPIGSNNRFVLFDDELDFLY